MTDAHEDKHSVYFLFPVFDSAFFKPPDFFGAHGPCTGSISLGFRSDHVVRTTCTREALTLHAVQLTSLSYFGSSCFHLGGRFKFRLMGRLILPGLRMIAMSSRDMNDNM